MTAKRALPSSHGSTPPVLDALREVPSCMLCGSAERSPVFREGPFSVVRCRECRLVYVTPQVRPDALPEVYGESYWRSESPSERGYADYLADGPLYRRTFRRRMRLLQPYLPPRGRALDVGCAAGFFLEVLRERGWQVHGVEPSTTVARRAREEAGLDVHGGDLESAPFALGSFDLVSFWDVVEHLPDPAAVLRRGAALLREGGILVVETQNVESVFARLLGRRWHHYKHLEHLMHFGPATLDRLLRQAGLEPLRATSRYAGKDVSLAFVRERATRLHPVIARLLAPLAPLDRLSLYVNPADELIAVARKAGP